MLVGWLMDDDGWTHRLSNKQILGTSETHTQTKPWNLKIVQSYPQDHARPVWCFYHYTFTNIKHGWVNLHDIPVTNPPVRKFTIAYRDSKSRPLCAIKKLKLKDANAKTPEANAANLWFGQGPKGDEWFSLPLLLLDRRDQWKIKYSKRRLGTSKGEETWFLLENLTPLSQSQLG